MAKNNLITREECVSTHQSLMDKIDAISDKLGDVCVKVAELPGELIKELDKKYARKETEQEVEDLKDRIENRTYEWVKYLATLIIGGIVTHYLFNR